MYVDKCPSIPRRVIIIAVIHPHENYTDVTSMCDYSKTIGKLHVRVSIYEEEKKEEKKNRIDRDNFERISYDGK